jgi:NAD(P)-dependent dehydrogenase (short-subunit alcohol dehydrogenase family)
MPATSTAPSSTPAPSFRGKTIVVTGASRGIGAETARAFARAGGRVLLAARDEGALQKVAEGIRGLGGDAAVQPLNLGDPASVRSLGARVRTVYGRLDCAFNCAGDGLQPAPLAQIAPEEFDRVLRVTVGGTFLSMREEIPLMLQHGGGAIVNMASTAGVSAFFGGSPYVAAKHAVLGLTKAGALDYAQHGIRVNAVAPGPIDSHRLRTLPESYRDQVRAAVPMRRLGDTSEVANAVLWLCSEASGFVTGTTLFVDGGRTAGWA